MRLRFTLLSKSVEVNLQYIYGIVFLIVENFHNPPSNFHSSQYISTEQKLIRIIQSSICVDLLDIKTIKNQKSKIDNYLTYCKVHKKHVGLHSIF